MIHSLRPATLGEIFALGAAIAGLLEWIKPSPSSFPQVELVWFCLHMEIRCSGIRGFCPLAIIMILVYYELRVRKEGFDNLQTMETAGLATDALLPKPAQNPARQ